MYTSAALDLLTGAMQDIGVLAMGETLEAPESTDALVVLNQMLDAWALDRGLLYSLVRTTKTLGVGTASYTIGSAGSIAVARPTRLSKACLILDTGAATPLEVRIAVLSDEQYANWPQKTEQGSQPLAVFYDRSSDEDGYGLVYPLPIPNVGTTKLVLYTPGGAVSQFAALDTEYDLSEGFARAIRKNVALEIAPGYPQATVSVDLRNQARASLLAIKSAYLVAESRRNNPVLVGRGGSPRDVDTGQA